MLGPSLDLVRDEEQEENAEHEIKTCKPDQREERVAGVNVRARALCRSQETVNEPWLSSELRGHPSGRRRDVRKWKREHQHPERGPRRLESSAPLEELRKS